MGPVPVPVPSRGSIAVVLLLMLLGVWKLIDIFLWVEEQIYFLW